jgi:hypothetical protein
MRALAVLSLAIVCTAAPDAGIRAGVAVASSPGQWILAMDGAPLPIGSTVTLVTPDPPQQTQRARVSAQVSESPAMAKHDIPGPYYSLTPMDGAKQLPDLAVALVGRPIVTQVAGDVSLRGSAQHPGVRVRSCASSEGLHLTLWSGVPLGSERLWHQYYYLGYDVQPTCRPEDYRQ